MMRSEVPLVASSEKPGPGVIATRLEASIRDSGLFYESHLKRWFQGEGSRQQLLKEPQMQAGSRPLAPQLPSALAGGQPLLGLAPMTTPGSQVAGQGGAAILPNIPLVPVAPEAGLIPRSGVATAAGLPPASAASLPAGASQPAVTATQMSVSPAPLAGEGREVNQARAELSHAREAAELSASRPARDIVHESLQSLVRQQLEMLVMPTIRWEGDVWAGIFMALVVNLPAREEGQKGQSQEAESDEGWRSEMRLDVPSLGTFTASMWLHRSVLSIDFTSESTQVYQRIDAGLPALEQRLSALDLQKVQLRARYIEAEGADGNTG
ncbi:MAG: flagellar hook-length control protein FliK [Halomonas sp.]|nr:MAG: flagellar hook-length control protein FliK [Halomonas sp.]